CCADIVGYAGLNYSSPTLTSAMANLVPAFTYILAIIFRMEEVHLRKLSTISKLLGTLVSISGAFIVTFYKGPAIIGTTLTSGSSTLLHLQQTQNWVLGGLFTACACLLTASWCILQAIINIAYRLYVTAWCLWRTGPLFVALFKPLTIVIAIVIGVIFMKDILYLGSLIGALVLIIGFYAVMWGKAKEGENNRIINL
ncbi:UNVERIFIED_CONTAM: WAT1-related protein, partial [Sesamum latifolium]